MWIWKIKPVGVRFDIRTVRTKLEYHPTGTTPVSFLTTVVTGGIDFGIIDRGDVDHVIQRYLPLERNWFLAWYKVYDR